MFALGFETRIKTILPLINRLIDVAHLTFCLMICLNLECAQIPQGRSTNYLKSAVQVAFVYLSTLKEL